MLQAFYTIRSETQLNVTPHIAQNTTNRTSAVDARTTRHPGYAISQQKRKRTEEPFGWAKTIGGLARPIEHVVVVLVPADRRAFENEAGHR